MTASRDRPPASLPPRTRALLAQYRDAEEIPTDAEARIWAVVGADDALAQLPAVAPVAAGSAPPSTAPRWIAFGLVAAAALLLAWRFGGTTLEPEHAGASPEAAAMQGDPAPSRGEARAVRAPPPRPAPSVDPPVVEPPTSTVTDTAAPAPGAVSRRRQPSARAMPQAEPPPRSPVSSTLAAERALVAQAWQALARGDSKAARSTVAEHLRRFPAGLLTPEREAIDAIAHCREDRAQGAAQARTFHRAHPRSPLAGRVDQACEPVAEKK